MTFPKLSSHEYASLLTNVSCTGELTQTRSPNSLVRPKRARTMDRYMGHALQYPPKRSYILSTHKKSSHYFSLNNHMLQKVDCSLYLGVTLNHDLRWTTHINITKKASWRVKSRNRGCRDKKESKPYHTDTVIAKLAISWYKYVKTLHWYSKWN